MSCINENGFNVGNYGHLKENLQEIKRLKNEGKKICLFVGRTGDEALPEPKEGEVWVSLDRYVTSEEAKELGSKGFKKESELKNRIHLALDLNSVQPTILLAHLFDMVVVDRSTIHNLRGNFNSLAGILKKDGTLVCEADNYQVAISLPLPPGETPEQNIQKTKQKIVNNNQQTLEKLFDVVKREHGHYPYDTSFTGDCDYFIASHLKKEIPEGPAQKKFKSDK